jgi:AraC-like DNA-binding protein
MPDMPMPSYPKEQDMHFGYYVLFICVSGNLELIINDQPTTIAPFCLYSLTPETVVRPKIKSEDCVLRMLVFTKDFLLKNNFKSNALADFKFFSDSQYKITLKQDEVASLLQLYDLLVVKKDNSQTIYHVEIIRCLFYTFLYEAQAIYTKDVVNTGSSVSKREKDLNHKFNELIKAHATLQHSLKFYADSLFITPKYLISAIKNASGKTPGVLIDEALINEAKQYLIHSELPIVDISHQLQFTDIATFSKFFKRYTSLSPSAFRKSFQK